jgi:hypothetical protein
MNPMRCPGNCLYNGIRETGSNQWDILINDIIGISTPDEKRWAGIPGIAVNTIEQLV